MKRKKHHLKLHRNRAQFIPVSNNAHVRNCKTSICLGDNWSGSSFLFFSFTSFTRHPCKVCTKSSFLFFSFTSFIKTSIQSMSKKFNSNFVYKDFHTVYVKEIQFQKVLEAYTHRIFSGLNSNLHFNVFFNILAAFFVFQFLALRYLDIDASEQSTGSLSATGPSIFLKHEKEKTSS